MMNMETWRSMEQMFEVNITVEALQSLGLDPQEVIEDIEKLKAKNIAPYHVTTLFLLRRQSQSHVSSSEPV